MPSLQGPVHRPKGAMLLPMSTELIVVRHGETLYNTRNQYQGHSDSPLTADGEAQARALAPRIHALGTATALYCSDLKRARRTAELIALPGHHRVTPDPLLRERGYGIFEGRSRDEVQQAMPAGDIDYAPPGGESQRQLLRRVTGAFDAIATRHSGERVVVVSHGGVLIAFAKHVLGLPPAAPRRFHIHNTSLSVFERDDARAWSVYTLGDLAHLEASVGG